jgi:hypothetical protein
MERVVRSMWLDPSWLTWNMGRRTFPTLDREKAKRAYEIHEHACDRLAQGTTKLDRVDVITALKRAITQRVQTLKEAYALDRIVIPDKPKRDFELLEYLGIVRPLMLGRLVTLRNLLEHEDADPPSAEDCEILADFVWYFLRSTDVLVQNRLGTVSVSPHWWRIRPNDPEVRITYSDRGGEYKPHAGPVLSIIAYLPETSIAYDSRPNWIEVKGTMNADSRFVEGDFAPGSQMKQIWVWYFSLPYKGA